jgi:tRNA(Ile)-lysidine synthase
MTGAEPRHPFEREMERWCRRHRLLPAGCRVVVAVSGGPDSTALLHALAGLAAGRRGFRLVVAHLDHGLRGARGAADAAFVRREAARLGLPVRLGRARIRTRRGRTPEADARKARYAFLGRVAGRVRADRIALGHTADDQAETVLHRLCRGCGLRGVSAMAPARPFEGATRVQVVRPLLTATRADVLAYLGARRIPFRTDETNRTSDWTRNRIRNGILPRLSRDVHFSASSALARFAVQAAAAYRLIAESADAAGRRPGIRWSRGGCRVRVRRMSSFAEAVRTELWFRILERLGGGATPAYREIDDLESLRDRRAAVLSLRGGRILARRIGDEIRLIWRNVP